MPTDAYALEEAVSDGFLVPPRAVSVPLKFQREGITYDDLSEEEKEQWDALEWDEDGSVPDRVEAEAVNKWLFNKDTVDKVLEHLMTRGLKVAGGDRLGQDDHLRQEPRPRASSSPSGSTSTTRTTRASLRGSSTFETEYAQSLIDNFSIPAKDAAHRHLRGHARHRHRHPRGRQPGLLQAGAVEDEVLADGRPRHAAVPRPVRAGQGQRVLLRFRLLPEPGVLQPELPDRRKARLGESLGKRLFNARLELIGELDKKVSVEQAHDGGGHSGEAAATYGCRIER